MKSRPLAAVPAVAMGEPDILNVMILIGIGIPAFALLVLAGLVADRREIPGTGRRTVNAAHFQFLHKRRLDRRAIAATTEFPDEAPAASQRTVHLLYDDIRLAYPVKHGVAEHRVKFILEFQFAGVLLAYIQTKRPRGANELTAGIDTDGLATSVPQHPSQLAITTSKVQYPFAGAGIEEFQHGHAEIAHITSVSRVFIWIPDIWFHAHK